MTSNPQARPRPVPANAMLVSLSWSSTSPRDVRTPRRCLTGALSGGGTAGHLPGGEGLSTITRTGGAAEQKRAPHYGECGDELRNEPDPSPYSFVEELDAEHDGDDRVAQVTPGCTATSGPACIAHCRTRIAPRPADAGAADSATRRPSPFHAPSSACLPRSRLRPPERQQPDPPSGMATTGSPVAGRSCRDHGSGGGVGVLPAVSHEKEDADGGEQSEADVVGVVLDRLVLAAGEIA
jgi:hypothetical protein